MVVDLSSYSSSLIGTLSPFLTQVIRDRWIKVNDTSAHWLSLIVAAGCVSAAVWVNHSPFDISNFVANVGLAFTLSQAVYYNILRDSDNSRGLVVQDPAPPVPITTIVDDGGDP